MEPKDYKNYIQLGWANGWKSRPEIVKKCREADHNTVEDNLDPTHHGYDTLVTCEICKYQYHYDSSG